MALTEVMCQIRANGRFLSPAVVLSPMLSFRFATGEQGIAH